MAENKAENQLKIKEEFERVAKLLHTTYPIPTDEDIDRMANQLEEMLKHKCLNRYANAAIKEGYTKAVEMLRSRQKDFTGLEKLRSIRARAIASLTADWQLGKCSEEIFVGVIKTAMKK